MRKLIFQPEQYELTDEVIKGNKTGRQFLNPTKGVIGIFELLQSGVENSPLKGLTKKDFKVIKRLKESLFSLSRFKDEDEDSMCLQAGGPHELIIEEDEYDLMVRLFTSAADQFTSKIADQVDDVFGILEKAETFTAPKIVPDKPTEVVTKE